MPSSPVRVLLVDDDEEEYLIARMLTTKMQALQIKLAWEGQFSPALQAMRQNEYDAYLVDYRLGLDSGIDLIRQAIEGGCSAPLILMTGLEDPQTDTEALEAGAAFCLSKGNLNAVLLERAIRFSVKQKERENALRNSLNPSE